MADLSFLYKAHLKAEGHQLIKNLLKDKPEHIYYNIAKAHIYYWFNWFVLGNVSMQLWYEGYHFSNMNTQQIVTVNEALRTTTLEQILKAVQEQLNATYQNRIIPKTKKSKKEKGKEPAAQIYRITEEEFYYKIIFHDILYGNEEGTTLLDTPESITLQQHIGEYLPTLGTESTSIDLAMLTKSGLKAWLKEFFKNPQTSEAITTFVRGLLARVPMLQIADATASSAKATAVAGTLATTTEDFSQRAAPSPTATVAVKTKTQVQSQTPEKTKANAPQAKVRQRQQKYKQQKQEITLAISKCFIDGALQWIEYTKVLAMYENNQQFENLCYDILREQQIAYNEQQYKESKQQALQRLNQKIKVQISNSLSAPSTSLQAKAPEKSRSSLEPSTSSSVETSTRMQIVESSQAASSYVGSQKKSTKPKPQVSKQGKKTTELAQGTTQPKSKSLATEQIYNKVIRAIQQNNLALVQQYYNQYQFMSRFTQYGIILACQLNYPEILEFLLPFDPQMINDSSPELYGAIIQKHNELLAKLLKHIATESQQCDHRLLVVAIEQNNLLAVKLLLEKYPAMLNQIIFEGKKVSPLYIAVGYGCIDIVKFLLEKGAGTEQVYNQMTPLFIAAQNGHTEIVEALLAPNLKTKTNPNKARQDDEVTPLLIAVFQRHYKIVELLLKAGAIPNKAENDGTTPLIAAADKGDVKDVEIVELLLKAGANPNKAAADGTTALLRAAGGYAAIVKLLLAAGAVPNQAALDTATPLLFAAQNNQVEIVDLLLKAGANPNKAAADGTTPLLMAAHNGGTAGTEIVRLLLDPALKNKANPDHNLNGGDTALIIAADKGHVEIVKLLLAAAADPNKATRGGDTPLIIAANKGHVEIVRLLLAAGAELNKATANGVTPLMMAADKGHTEIVSLLLAAGADPNKARVDGCTPLMMAVYFGHAAIVSQLLTVTSKSLFDRISFMMLAIKQGYLEVVKVLLETNIDLSVETADSILPEIFLQTVSVETADSILAKFFSQVLKNPELVTIFHKILPLIIQRGANIDCADQNGNTYLIRAIISKRIDLVKILLDNYADPTMEPLTRDGIPSKRTALSVVKQFAARSQDYQAILELLQSYSPTRPVPAQVCQIQQSSTTPVTPVRLMFQVLPASFTPAYNRQAQSSLMATDSQVGGLELETLMTMIAQAGALYPSRP